METDDCSEIALKKICCTCLCVDRKLYQLCRIPDGVNNLYLLLSFDSEAYREGFHKDTANLYVCWECRAIMKRIRMFRQQACTAQLQLSYIADGKIDMRTLPRLSLLKHCHITTFKTITANADLVSDNFIDCGFDIKTESEEDIPLSELCYSPSDIHINAPGDSVENGEATQRREEKSDSTAKKIKLRTKQKNIICDNYKKKKKIKIKTKEFEKGDNKKYFITIKMDDNDMVESRKERKLAALYADAKFKCDSCIEGFKNQNELESHFAAAHQEKPNHVQCDICLTYVKESKTTHREMHYQKYVCKFCDYTAYNMTDVIRHLKSGHSIQNLLVPVERIKGRRKTPKVLNPGSKPRRNQAMTDKRTPFGYQCTECSKYFENKNQRWKHVQRFHREGYKCRTCGKKFAFKNNLSRHELLHESPPPREECPECHKMIRVDLVKVHAKIHSTRERYTCLECDKCFVSRASYEHHLKYTQAHSALDVLKYKCSVCDKGYRSRGELRDHVNYQHMGKTQHKCPICGKALATRRCITRHVRRAHRGLAERARDKICQQCGKAFRDKKGLREHEFIHTGERPLSCEICGCTFRQSASLYTHRKRVHKILIQKKIVTLVEDVEK